MSKVKSKSFTNTDFVLRPIEPSIQEAFEQTVSDTVVGFTIEDKEIPKRSGRKGTLNYPIEKLTAGSKQSFLVPVVDGKLKKVTASIRTYAYRNDFKITLRAEDSGVRVWRKS